MILGITRGIFLTLAILGVTITSAQSASAAQGTRPCPSYYYCFYEHANYQGWRLNYMTTTGGEFNNPPASSGDRRNQLSSMINNSGKRICVYDRVTARPDRLLWRLEPHQDVPFIGAAANDKADYWKAC